MVAEAEFKKHTEQNCELAESRNRRLRERERISELQYLVSFRNDWVEKTVITTY